MKTLLASSRLSLRLSAWNISAPTGKEFHEIWIFFRISLEKCQDRLKPDKNNKNNRYYAWRRMYIYDISVNYLFQDEKFFGQML